MSAPVLHPIPPVACRDPDRPPQVLILGSFPSVKSRETAFFYGHPRNRFWRVISDVLECPLPVSTEEKIALLWSHGVALWDVVASCTVTGSADASIRNVTPTDLFFILGDRTVTTVITNGGTATRLYQKYQAPLWPHVSHISLPSTSPANAAMSYEALLAAWSVLKQHCTAYPPPIN